MVAVLLVACGWAGSPPADVETQRGWCDEKPPGWLPTTAPWSLSRDGHVDPPCAFADSQGPVSGEVKELVDDVGCTGWRFFPDSDLAVGTYADTCGTAAFEVVQGSQGPLVLGGRPTLRCWSASRVEVDTDSWLATEFWNEGGLLWVRFGQAWWLFSEDPILSDPDADATSVELIAEAPDGTVLDETELAGLACGS